MEHLLSTQSYINPTMLLILSKSLMATIGQALHVKRRISRLVQISYTHCDHEPIKTTTKQQNRTHTTAMIRGLKPFVMGAPVWVPPVPLRVSTHQMQQLTVSMPEICGGRQIGFHLCSPETLRGGEGKGRMWADFTVHCWKSFLQNPKLPWLPKTLFSSPESEHKPNKSDPTSLQVFS